ncbi:MAG: murein L,D-transpeptidase family protein, partial [Pseudomonadota bacterium]
MNATQPIAAVRKPRRSGKARALISASVLTLLLAGCQVSELAHEGAHMAPLPASLERKIDRMGMNERSPILLRIYKSENALEVWKEDRTGRYQMLKEYEICAWSGKLGPKIKEGDRQAPEGFYSVTPGQMNPNSSYHLSFNIGFPNKFDRSHGRTGSHLMVHGDCSSRGCYAMEDAQIQEIYALAREAFRGGQQAFQIQAFPFRMTPENM